MAAEAAASDAFVTPNPIQRVVTAKRAIALEGGDITAVNNALGARITAYGALTIARPTLYGQTRHSYEIDLTEAGATDVKRAAAGDIQFRAKRTTLVWTWLPWLQATGR